MMHLMLLVAASVRCAIPRMAESRSGNAFVSANPSKLGDVKYGKYVSSGVPVRIRFHTGIGAKTMPGGHHKSGRRKRAWADGR